MSKIKKISPILWIFLGTTILILLAWESYQPVESGKEDENPSEPYRRLADMRAWPDAEFDQLAYERALEAARYKPYQRGGTIPGVDAAWRLEGPTNVGGKINHIAVHPLDHKIIYISTPNGGIFKTTNAGLSWTPIFDDQPTLSVSYIEFNPMNPEILWAATGDVDIQGFPFVGAGAFKSNNGGKTWQYMGLKQAGIISKIAINPNDTNVIYASAMGRPMKADTNRGLYKSADGGKTWNTILYISENTGITDFIMDRTNPDHLLAAAYTRLSGDSVNTIGGNECGIWQSFDGGDHWNLLTSNQGLPSITFSRIGLHQHEKYPQVIYALISDLSGKVVNGLVKTSDGGQTWNQIGQNIPSTATSYYGWYFGRVFTDPVDTNEIYILGVDQWRTLNGGQTWNACTPPWSTYEVHGDGHWMTMLGQDSIYLATDGGLYLTTNNTTKWVDKDLIPNTEFYKIVINPFETGRYSGGAQDNGTSDGGADISDNWTKAFGGDGFQPLFDYNDDQVRYYTTQNGVVNSSMSSSSLLVNGGGNRVNWDMPFIMSAFNSKVLYGACEKVVRDIDGEYGSFKKISPDLTRGSGNIYALCENSLSKYRLYAGTTDGLVWRTTNYGVKWDSIKTGLPNRAVTSIKTSHLDSNLIYVSHTGYRSNEYIPHIHRSYNNGNTWQDISGDLPPLGINDICTWPFNDSVLFAATDGGVYITIDAAQSWQRLGKGMPYYPVFDIELDTFTHRLVAGTFARSMLSFPLDSVLSWPNGPNTYVNVPTASRLNIYPNPTQNYMTLEAGIFRGGSFYLYDLNGKLIQSARINTDHVRINLESQPAGTYILRTENGKLEAYEKVLKF